MMPTPSEIQPMYSIQVKLNKDRCFSDGKWTMTFNGTQKQVTDRNVIWYAMLESNTITKLLKPICEREIDEVTITIPH